ncbi:MAG: hypothetical protein AABY18_09785 [Candidatus Thermoplasmatota archaeon]
MRAVWTWTLAALVHVAMLVVTAFPPFAQSTSPSALGVPTWHHNASLALVVLFSAVFWRRMTTDRRFLGMGVLVTTFLALASAFLLLYLKQELKVAQLKDWAKFWHVAWSWFGLAFFLGHTWVNRSGLGRSLRRMTGGGGGWLFYGLLTVIVVAIPVTWSPWGARVFTDPAYIPLTLYTWLVFLVPSYAAWMASVVQTRNNEGMRPAWWPRAGTQAFVDSWLLPVTILANLSGFPILYFGTKDTALKYVAKYWHTWPSIAMGILVFAHTIQFLPAVARYAKARPAEA